MAKKELICIVCPRGCHLEVDENMNVTGNFCPRGAKYAIDELTHPTRIVTSTVKIKVGDTFTRVSVKTSNPIPKEKIFDIMKEIDKVLIEAPVHIGDVIIKNVCSLDSDIVATKEIGG